MAKKTPKTQTSTEETTNNAVQQEVQKAAVNVDSKNESSKAKKSANTKKTSDKPNIFKRMGKGIKGIVSELKKGYLAQGKRSRKEYCRRIDSGCAFLRHSFRARLRAGRSVRSCHRRQMGNHFHLIVRGQYGKFGTTEMVRRPHVFRI